MTPWTVARHAPRSIGFSWQECWIVLQTPPGGSTLPRDGTHISYISSLSLVRNKKKSLGNKTEVLVARLRNGLNVMKFYTLQWTLSTPFSTATQGASYLQPFQLSRPAGAPPPGARPWPGWRPGAPPSGTRPRGPCR